MRSIAANCFFEYMSFTYGVRKLAYSPPYQRQLTMPLQMREYVSECYGRNRGLRFPHVSPNALRSWFLNKPTLTSARLLEALSLLTVKLMVKPNCVPLDNW